MRTEGNPQNRRIAIPCCQCGAHFLVWPGQSARRKFCDAVCRRDWYASPVRFWEKVAIGEADGCWPWVAGSDTDGYGVFHFAGQPVRAHRHAFFLTHGRKPWPHCLHACDNPPCCNPAHLSEGTNAENMAQRRAAGRYWRGETQRSAKLTAADIPAIRASLAAGQGAPSIGRRYGVSHRTIYEIKYGKTWQHVP